MGNGISIICMSELQTYTNILSTAENMLMNEFISPKDKIIARDIYSLAFYKLLQNGIQGTQFMCDDQCLVEMVINGQRYLCTKKVLDKIQQETVKEDL